LNHLFAWSVSLYVSYKTDVNRLGHRVSPQSQETGSVQVCRL